MNVRPSHQQVDRIFAKYNRPGSAGCALAVIWEGEIVYKQGYGLADIELQVPVLPSTLFNIGSMAKQFTAFAVALLEEDGKLSLEDEIQKYLPEMHDFGETITLRHLIHHSSGLRDSFPELLALAEWRESDVTTVEDVYRLLVAQRELNYRPGDEFLYANSNYVLLALICERASGRTFAGFCQERIFKPLGMDHSVVNDYSPKLIPGRARGYYEQGEGRWLNVQLADSVIGSTNIYSTVEDMARWDENFHSGKVGGPAVLERIHRRGKLNDGTELDYAFGLELGPKHMHRGWQVVEHGGGHGGYCCHMVRFPECRLSVVVMFNGFLWESREYALKVADLFLKEKSSGPTAPAEHLAQPASAEPVVLDEEQLRGKVGSYFDAGRGALRVVTCTDGRLKYQGLELVPVSENRFFFQVEPDTRIEFRSAQDGAPAGLKTITPLGEYCYDRVEVVANSPKDLGVYSGRYYSSELDITWTIVAGEGQLLARRRKYAESILTPLFADAFNDDWLPIMGYPTNYLILFERNGEGVITGLCASGSRVRNLYFALVKK